MGRKSIKEKKSIYQQTRENLDLTRSNVADVTNNLLSESRVEKIENGSAIAHPEDVVLMSKIYNSPELCNYYCTKECEIGKIYVPKVETIHDLPQITMELLSSLNALIRERDRIIDITADGKIDEHELKDFNSFKEHLSEMSLAIETLKLWADKNNI